MSMSAREPTCSSRAKAASLAIWAKRRGRIAVPAGSISASLWGSSVSSPVPFPPCRDSWCGVRRGLGVAVVVEALAALAAQPAFGDEGLLDRAGAPALGLAALGVEGAGDAEVDVEADQVDQLEGAHAEAAAQAADAVDRRRVGDSVGEHAQRLQGEGAGEAVGDEPGAVLGPDRGTAHAHADRGGGVQRRRAESAVATTSTSFISAGGLKKCMPTTRSRPGTPAAIAVIGSEEVLLARIVSGPQASARAAKSSRLRSGPRARPRPRGRIRRGRRGCGRRRRDCLRHRHRPRSTFPCSPPCSGPR